MRYKRVPRYKRRIEGKWRDVSGYSAPIKKGKKRITNKKMAWGLYSTRDEYGRWKGWRRR